MRKPGKQQGLFFCEREWLEFWFSMSSARNSLKAELQRVRLPNQKTLRKTGVPGNSVLSAAFLFRVSSVFHRWQKFGDGFTFFGSPDPVAGA